MQPYSEEAYQAQLSEKVTRLTEAFAEFVPPELEVFESPRQHYRMRAEFRLWHEGDDLYYIMFDQATKQKVKVENFPPASKLINDLMPVLISHIRENTILRNKIFQIDFLSSLHGEILVSLLYHRQLDEEWEAKISQLKQALTEQGFPIHFIGRARKQKKVFSQEHIIEKLTVGDRTLTYQQVENSFTQPNASVATKMLKWAIDCTKGSQDHDLLELYCGNGNFSIALAPNFRNVIGTELAKPSVESAQWNIAANGADNVKIARLSAEEFTEAMQGERTFNRLTQNHILLDDYDFKTVLVDPPRAGMDDASTRMVQQYDRIVYISCNPDTLKQNLDILGETHQITRFALFDQFPYTHHTEAGILLERK